MFQYGHKSGHSQINFICMSDLFYVILRKNEDYERT